MNEFPAAPTDAPAYPLPPPLLPRGLLLGVLLIATGMLIMVVVGGLEYGWLAEQPWHAALIVAGRPVDAEDALPVWIRAVPREKAETGNPFLDELQAGFDAQHMDITVFPEEYAIMAEVSEDMLAKLTVTGRPPVPGRAEALAGDLALGTPFVLDGVAFDVVGLLDQGISGFPFAYLVPRHPALAAIFEDSTETLEGVLIEDGLMRLYELFGGDTSGAVVDLPEDVDALDDEETESETFLLGGRARTRLHFAWAVVAALMITTLGGAIVHVSLFVRWGNYAPRMLRPVLRAIAAHPALFTFMHLLLYGLFFAAMAQGVAQPVLNYVAADYIGSIFTEGGLSYIGDAYASGEIVRAAAATFFNNYIVQTLGLTFGISIVPLALGVVKTALSFIMVGFVMAPVWTGIAAGYSFHSITMVLELEAYIVACFVVVLWTRRCFRAMYENRIVGEMRENFALYGSGIVLTGLMLALAAFYEAATLILL